MPRYTLQYIEVLYDFTFVIIHVYTIKSTMSEQYLSLNFSKQNGMTHLNFWNRGEGLPWQDKKICQKKFNLFIAINVDGHCS